jgi:glycosyltransferase involved in cell wall biosynthesis
MGCLRARRIANLLLEPLKKTNLPMAETPLVSCLIPAYNGAAFLGEALISVQQQTCQDFEIIVVDDGSTDHTFELAREFAAADPRIKAFRQANGGTQAARNTALQHARGEWIALLDQDDVWLPDKLASQLDLLKERPRPNLLFSNYFVWDGKSDLGTRHTQRRKFYEGDVSEHLVRSCLFGASSVMVLRDMVNSVGGFDPAFHLAGDWDMWLRLAERGVWARGVWQPQMRYRLWAGNESKKIIPMAQETLAVLEKALARPQKAALRRNYQQAARVARSNLELARARQLIETHPDQLSAAIFRAWQFAPSRFRWLLRYWGLSLPDRLGGESARAHVQRKLREKW